ncbi:BTB/POZ domain-containing protein [Pyrus ussuriensis x Pyrus communis]|uniref:BTB/POZ domain-containing protein n=1 Tax=Pyrus ussuriensis x Pyrus communis TaxID=2448454 RepID=A0A5N5H4B3_9ROSA|nr:BTB/POZ domain-containing protein At5g66560 isoform X1 [Pyrus x bretschneideri]KAB2617964.1 BTB/POZ domain-containing protein [Pyrus ussuriensis x Pyrus communis]
MAAATAAAAAAAEKSSSKGQAWFCTTGLPSDIVVQVDDMTFHLHKFPLMSKSRKLHNLITEQETNPSKPHHRMDDDDDEIEQVQCQISLSDFPGGSETFEIAAKFCYGVKIDLSSSNVVPLRCAGEYLDMTEEYSEDNLISKTERFLSQSALKSFKESLRALKSCERVMPLAENLGITQRCIDSVASRATSADPSLFGWPVSNGGPNRNANADAVSASSASKQQVLWNAIDAGGGRRRSKHADSWLEDLVVLSLPLFKRLISAMKSGDLSLEMVETCLMQYAKKYIPGISRTNRKPSSSTSAAAATTAAESSRLASESQQRELLETIISNLPLEKSSRPSTATRFLFGLLRTANILNASEACKAALEKKIASQLHQATLDDLLFPSYSYLNETLYDVDCIERILGYFLNGLDQGNTASIEDGSDGSVRSPSLMLVGKLMDEFLSEIASDANLKPDRLYNLAISLPDQARLFDDGLYRAVDVYLKAHPWLSEPEREKVCGILDCQKLTLEACTHAAQNERLPLRAVVQVLFFEQLQLRHAIAGTLLAADVVPPESSRPSVLRHERDDEEEEEGDAAEARRDESGGTRQAAVRQNQVLRLDMDSMRTRVRQLERECSSMKKVIEQFEKPGQPGRDESGRKDSLIRRFGCKFKTQVCDSHEPTVVDTRKGRRRHHHQQ